MPKLYSPTKKEITGVVATIPGIMEIRDLHITDQNTIAATHLNVFTELWMEESEYLEEEGKGLNGSPSLTYRDTDGRDWFETDLVLEDGSPIRSVING